MIRNSFQRGNCKFFRIKASLSRAGGCTQLKGKNVLIISAQTVQPRKIVFLKTFNVLNSRRLFHSPHIKSESFESAKQMTFSRLAAWQADCFSLLNLLPTHPHPHCPLLIPHCQHWYPMDTIHPTQHGLRRTIYVMYICIRARICNMYILAPCFFLRNMQYIFPIGFLLDAQPYPCFAQL